MESQPNPDRTKLSRLLVAGDRRCDPHRVVRLCCECCQLGTPALTLLVARDEGAQEQQNRPGMSEALARATAMLLDGAGLRVEDIVIADERDSDVDDVMRLGEFDALLVCTPPGEQPAPLPALAVRLARRYALPVLDGGHRLSAPRATRRRTAGSTLRRLWQGPETV